MGFTRPNGIDRIAPGNYIQTLVNCQGFYTCPRDQAGNLVGPIVGYAADHPSGDGTKWVGPDYINFSMADQWPAVLKVFAGALMYYLDQAGIIPTVVLGAPMAGIKLSGEVARLLQCRSIYAEKKPIRVGIEGQRDVTELVLPRYDIYPGDKVLIGEELVNNLSTTGELCDLVEAAGGTVVGISCAVNRSSPHMQTLWRAPDHDPIRIIAVVDHEMSQYHRSDPVVAEAIARYGLVAKSKYEWPKLQAAMDAHR